MSDTQAPQVKEEPMEYFIHDCKLEKCTSQTGWEYVKCPMSDCFVFTGLNRVNDYLKNVQDQIPTWYKWNKDKLKCFCSHPMVLCQSRSEKNPDRIYFKGFTYGPEYRDDLLQIVYLMETLKRRQQFNKKRQGEIRKDNSNFVML